MRNAAPGNGLRFPDVGDQRLTARAAGGDEAHEVVALRLHVAEGRGDEDADLAVLVHCLPVESPFGAHCVFTRQDEGGPAEGG